QRPPMKSWRGTASTTPVSLADSATSAHPPRRLRPAVTQSRELGVRGRAAGVQNGRMASIPNGRSGAARKRPIVRVRGTAAPPARTAPIPEVSPARMLTASSTYHRHGRRPLALAVLAAGVLLALPGSARAAALLVS